MVELDLKSHVDFFDRLVELIPAKHYLADPDERVDLRHMKKKDRQAAKEQFKKQHKETKKASLDPSTAKGTLELLKLKSEAEEQARSAGGASGEGPSSAKGPIDREALRAKLQARLEDLRKQRKADEQEKKVDSAKQWRDTALEQGRKKAVEKRKQEALKPSSAGGKQQGQQEKQDRRPAKQQRTDRGAGAPATAGGNSAAAGAGLTFSKVDFGNGAHSSDRRKGKHKMSKAELLQEAEKRQAGGAGAGASGGDGEEQEAWGAALKRAQGEKVFDDPKLLRKSMKKDAKMKQKKSKVWNERLEKQKEGQEAKQAKRRTNLQRRVDAKKEAKKAKREKKLLRAGFEGRKKTFITTPSPKPPKS
jgi:Surfeit locus protein 6/60S ribosome biogenesis protein Rrp14